MASPGAIRTTPQPAIRASIQTMRIDRGRSYQEIPERGEVALWDLDLAAFLMCRGYAPVDIWREGSEFRIVFQDPDNKIRDMHIEFLSSPEGRFAGCIKQLKKAAHSIGPRPPQEGPRR